MPHKSIFNAVSLAVLASCSAHANLAIDEDSIERISVTGQEVSATATTRSTLTLNEYPQSVHVVGRELIDSQLAIDLTDVVRNVSGIQGKASYDPMGSGLSGDYLIRGLWSESYVNGRQTFLNVGLDPISLINIERVEVLKGTSAMLFAGGYGAPNGGIINMAEKTPRENASASLGLVTGSFGTWGIDADINQPLSDVWSFRLTADVTDRDINIDDITQRVNAIYPTLKGNFGATELIVRGRYQHLKYDYYHGLNGATEAVLDDSLKIVGSTVPAFRNIASGRIPTSEAESSGLDIEVTHQFSTSLVGSARASVSKADDLNHYVFFVTDTGNLDQNADIVNLNGDLTYSTTFGDWASSTTLIADHANTNIAFLDTYNSAGFGTFTTPIEGSYETSNLGIQQTFSLNNSLRVLTGATYSDMALDYAVDGSANEGIDEQKVNWKLGVSYDLTSALTPFASVNQGYRLPTPTVVASRFFEGTPELESTRQIEAGLKFAFDSSVTGSVAFFDNALENAAESIDFTPLQLDQESQGIDVDVTWQPIDTLTLSLNYTHLDAEITERDSVYEGNTPFNLPENFGRLYAQYMPHESWIVGAGVSFGDERAGGLNNAFFTESYTLVDAQISYVQPSYSVRLGIDNLLDADHFEPVLFFGGGYFDQTQPRTITLRTTFSY